MSAPGLRGGLLRRHSFRKFGERRIGAIEISLHVAVENEIGVRIGNGFSGELRIRLAGRCIHWRWRDRCARRSTASTASTHRIGRLIQAEHLLLGDQQVDDRIQMLRPRFGRGEVQRQSGRSREENWDFQAAILGCSEVEPVGITKPLFSRA